MLDTHKLHCPYCGEYIEIVIDLSVEEQTYIEDCSVCCRPITLTITTFDEHIDVVAKSENE